MSDLLTDCAAVLEEAGFTINFVEIPGDGHTEQMSALAFEDATILGFVVRYASPESLLDKWKSDGNRVAMRHRDALQRARQKAWNAYLVLMTEAPATIQQSLLLGQIEEDLEAMRKIAQAGVAGPSAVRRALLPLLPFNSAPVLDPINMREEIALRSSELDRETVQAFLSDADESTLLQLLEDLG